MKITSIAAIYFLFWVMSFMLVLPFGVRTHDEAGVKKVPGQADSAPVEFSWSRNARRASLVALVLFGLYYVNYVNGWIDRHDIDVTNWF